MGVHCHKTMIEVSIIRSATATGQNGFVQGIVKLATNAIVPKLCTTQQLHCCIVHIYVLTYM